MTKFKHNKKRNSAFLYETLIQELTKCVLSKDAAKQKSITELIKESFSANTEMYKELKLYHAIMHTKSVESNIAEKILSEVKVRHSNIDKEQLISEQNKLTRHIRKSLSNEVFINFIPNYKDLASISQIFNNRVSVKSKVLLENELVEKMVSAGQEKKMVPVDNLVYKSFVSKFNEKYGDTLFEEQKILLNKFITSFDNNGLELKSHLNEEIGRLKKELQGSLKTEEIVADQEMSQGVKKVLDILEHYKSQPPNKEMVEEIIKIQALVKESSLNVN
jgi:DNA-binding transcriptional regulator GbsR (MarR family)